MSEVGVRDEVSAAIRRYLEAHTLAIVRGEIDPTLFIEDFGGFAWTPEHYRELCWMIDNGFYRESTRHWADTRERQRTEYPRCHECGRTASDRTLDAHHLCEYSACAGAERVGVDLQTLCRPCHRNVHKSARAAKAAAKARRRSSRSSAA